jgi:catechol 2,3-dioxygenase-like lactoylglutathione lyase family enzyme
MPDEVAAFATQEAPSYLNPSHPERLVTMRMKMRSISTLALALFFAAGPGMRAQAPGAAQTPAAGPGITGIAHVAFRVSDIDKEVNFLGKLGYEEAFASTSGAKTMEVFVKVNDRQFIEIYPQTDPKQPLGWMHVCYESDDLNGLDALYASRGLNPSKVVKAGAGNLIFSLKDPEGRVTEFTQYMPDSRHTLDKGQHLGGNRISDSLLGFDLPVADLAAAKQFYTKLGFDVEDAGSSIHLSTPSAPDLRIVLHTAAPNSEPQMLFPVPDAHRAADQLHHMGLKVNRQGKLVFVRDPDGNSFVLLETGSAQ